MSTAPPCGATSAMSTARWRIIRKRSVSAPAAPVSMAAAASSICASAITSARSPTSTTPCRSSRARRITCCVRARQDSGDFDRALADYAEAERLDAKNISIYTAQAAIWTMKDDFDKTIAVYDRAIAADQTRAATYALRAHAYDQKGDRKRAMSDISRAIKLSAQADFLNLRG